MPVVAKREGLNVNRLKPVESLLLIISHRRLFLPGLRVLAAAVTEFFYPQFETRLRPGIRPIVAISHPLDGLLPFVPREIATYLGYIGGWLKSLLYLYKAFGKRAFPDIEQALRELRLIYLAAGNVYRKCQSTTTGRPLCLDNPRFLLIRVFDPHLHCIPSLHVMTVCYAYFHFRRVVWAHRSNPSTHERAIRQVYRLALRVTEAMLLIKQHSLADVGPSLFLFSCLFEDYDKKEVWRFLSDLFDASVLIPEADKWELRRQIYDSYLEMQRRARRRSFRTSTELLLDLLGRFRS